MSMEGMSEEFLSGEWRQKGSERGDKKGHKKVEGEADKKGKEEGEKNKVEKEKKCAADGDAVASKSKGAGIQPVNQSRPSILSQRNSQAARDIPTSSFPSAQATSREHIQVKRG